MKMKPWSSFIEPIGGMLALLPVLTADCWRGALKLKGEISDYDRLQDAVRHYACVRTVFGKTCLVFAGDRTPTSWCSDGSGSLKLLRLVSCEDENILLSYAERRPNESPLEVIGGIELSDTEYRIIDIALPIEKSDANSDVIRLSPGSYRLSTWEDAQKAGSVIIHWLERER